MRYIFKIMTVDVHVHPEFIPWLGECVNPRTKQKGYKTEWTDDDLYGFFGISKDEKNLIISTMEKYE